MSTPWIYLASKSPRRRELLAQIGMRFEMLLPDTNEDAESIETVQAGDTPECYVRRVVEAKLDRARGWLAERQLPLAPILSSDTTVALGGKILGKPATVDEAIEMLSRLSGRSHRVLTAIAVSHGAQGQRTRQCIQVSRVSFARIDKAAIAAYVALGESFDKAGSYGIQGPAAAFVRRIEGSYSGIMGLPLYETAKLLGIHHAHRQRNSDQSHRP
jgi:septum formation protein